MRCHRVQPETGLFEDKNRAERSGWYLDRGVCNDRETRLILGELGL